MGSFEKGTDSIRIRAARVGDIREIVEIGKRNFPASDISEAKMLERITRGHFLFVAEFGGEIAGFIDIKFGISRAHISGLATKPGFRGKGVGGALLAHAVEVAKKKGKQHITLRVAAKNQRALNLYRKQGFIVLGRKKRAGVILYRMVRRFET
jgi:[ribosomal protein S18]-alanine N-acetyltransferase